MLMHNAHRSMKQEILSKTALYRARLKSWRFYKTKLNNLYFLSNTVMMITLRRIRCAEQLPYIVGNKK
jgi:hypothetical protein